MNESKSKVRRMARMDYGVSKVSKVGQSKQDPPKHVLAKHNDGDQRVCGLV